MSESSPSRVGGAWGGVDTEPISATVSEVLTSQSEETAKLQADLELPGSLPMDSSSTEVALAEARDAAVEVQRALDKTRAAFSATQQEAASVAKAQAKEIEMLKAALFEARGRPDNGQRDGGLVVQVTVSQAAKWSETEQASEQGFARQRHSTAAGSESAVMCSAPNFSPPTSRDALPASILPDVAALNMSLLPPPPGNETSRPRLRSQHFDELGNVPQKNLVVCTVVRSGASTTDVPNCAEPTPNTLPNIDSIIKDGGSKFENCAKHASPEFDGETKERPHEKIAALMSMCSSLKAENALLTRQLEGQQRFAAADDLQGWQPGSPSGSGSPSSSTVAIHMTSSLTSVSRPGSPSGPPALVWS